MSSDMEQDDTRYQMRRTQETENSDIMCEASDAMACTEKELLVLREYRALNEEEAHSFASRCLPVGYDKLSPATQERLKRAQANALALHRNRMARIHELQMTPEYNAMITRIRSCYTHELSKNMPSRRFLETVEKEEFHQTMLFYSNGAWLGNSPKYKSKKKRSSRLRIAILCFILVGLFAMSDVGQGYIKYLLSKWNNRTKTVNSEMHHTAKAVQTGLYKPVEINSKGEKVRQLQTKLKSLGYPIGVVDGVYGNETAAAVEEFNTNNKISSGDKASRETLWTLYSNSAVGVNENRTIPFFLENAEMEYWWENGYFTAVFSVNCKSSTENKIVEITLEVYTIDSNEKQSETIKFAVSGPFSLEETVQTTPLHINTSKIVNVVKCCIISAKYSDGTEIDISEDNHYRTWKM